MHGRADGVIDLADQIDERAFPVLVEAMDGASEMFLQDVQRRLEKVSDVPAEPGESPHRIKGELLASIKKIGTKVKDRTVTGGVYTFHPSAALLEYGGVVLSRSMKAIGAVATRTIRSLNVSETRRLKKQLKDIEGSHQRAPHPYFRPAEMAMETKIQQHLEEAIR